MTFQTLFSTTTTSSSPPMELSHPRPILNNQNVLSQIDYKTRDKLMLGLNEGMNEI